MTKLMENKRGLIMGVANDKSIAWGIAKALSDHGAELAFTYQGEAFEKRVKPLAESLGADIVLDCDASKDQDLDAVFSTIEEKWGKLDFIVHAIAYSDKEELKMTTGRSTLRIRAKARIMPRFSKSWHSFHASITSDRTVRGHPPRWPSRGRAVTSEN